MHFFFFVNKFIKLSETCSVAFLDSKKTFIILHETKYSVVTGIFDEGIEICL